MGSERVGRNTDSSDTAERRGYFIGENLDTHAPDSRGTQRGGVQVLTNAVSGTIRGTRAFRVPTYQFLSTTRRLLRRGSVLVTEFVDQVGVIVAHESTAPGVVVHAARRAVVCDRFHGAGRVVVRADVGIEKSDRQGTTWTDPESPGEPKIRLVSGGLEAPTGRNGHVFCTNHTGRANIPELHVVAESAVAVYTPTKLLVTRPRRHRSPAHLAMSDIADA